jgi:16S rRNA (cytidine1402-2'-O)-methyltransferase
VEGALVTTAASAAGTLYVVSTPIGNLGDLSPRAVEVLGAVAAVLAEDTRHTRILWERFAIRTPLIAHHEHNEAETTPGLVARLLAGESLALVTDAGTPLLSDPGARLVRAAIDGGVRISPVPGASALLAALVGAGLDATAFTFLGFLPHKGAERAARLAAIAALEHTVVLLLVKNCVITNKLCILCKSAASPTNKLRQVVMQVNYVKLHAHMNPNVT